MGRSLRHRYRAVEAPAAAAVRLLPPVRRRQRRGDDSRGHGRRDPDRHLSADARRSGAQVHLRPDRQQRFDRRQLRHVEGVRRDLQSLLRALRAKGRAGAVRRERADQRCHLGGRRRRDHRPRHPPVLRDRRPADDPGLRRHARGESGDVHRLRNGSDGRVVRRSCAVCLGCAEERRPGPTDARRVPGQAALEPAGRVRRRCCDAHAHARVRVHPRRHV